MLISGTPEKKGVWGCKNPQQAQTSEQHCYQVRGRGNPLPRHAPSQQSRSCWQGQTSVNPHVWPSGSWRTENVNRVCLCSVNFARWQGTPQELAPGPSPNKPKQNACENNHNSVVHNNSEREAFQGPRWMDKQNVGHGHRGMALSSETEHAPDTYKNTQKVHAKLRNTLSERSRCTRWHTVWVHL